MFASVVVLSRFARTALVAMVAPIAVGSLPGSTTPAIAATAAACPATAKTSQSFINDRGVEVSGGKCIPDDRVPGTAEYSYIYEPLCQPNVPDDCAPRVCDTAEAPARLFLVTQITLATGITEAMGGGCYSTKNEPPKVTPGDVLKAFRRVPIPTAEITVQPPGGRTLVNFKTIVSSQAAPFEVDVSIFDQNVHLWIKPVSWTWDFGDGTDPLVRPNAGVPWIQGVATSQIAEDTYTFHEYAAATSYGIGLTVRWTADYRVADNTPAEVPGSVDITSPIVEVQALEADPKLVEPPS